MIALILAGSTLTPRWWTKNPKQLPEVTQKPILAGHFQSMLLQFVRYDPEMLQMINSLAQLNNQAINITFHNIYKNFLEDYCHCTLLCSPGVFSPNGITW